MRQPIKQILFSLTIALSLNYSFGATPERPNVLLILTDDQGWWDLGCHDNPAIETPNMDGLARDGVEFQKFYVEPVCAPTRAGLMTGRYFLRTGLYNTRFGGDAMAAEEITIAEILKAQGYHTGLFGKWHLGRYAKYHPCNQGFDQFLGFLEGHTERYDYPDLWQNFEPVKTRGYITDLFTDAAISFMERNQREPFFCYLAYNAPHSPWIVGDAHGTQETGDALITKYMEKGLPIREARIYAMIERIDGNLGRLFKRMDELDLTRNTLVLFMHDNGGVSKYYKGPLKGGKATVFEGGVRSPLFARLPGRFPAGAKVDAISSHVDILPTICDLVGAPVPQDRPIDGKSLLPLMLAGGGESPHKYVYHHWDRYFPNTTNRWAIGTQHYKLTQGALYDLTQDESERKDLAKEHPEIVKELRDEFVRWFDDVTSGQIYQPAPVEIGRDDENPVELQTSWALLDGENINYVFLAYHWDTVDGWKLPNETARWNLTVTQPGTYKVKVSYGADWKSDGNQFKVTLADQSLQGTVEATLDREVFIQRDLGEVNLSAGPTQLVVQPVKVHGPELMALNRIWLERVTK